MRTPGGTARAPAPGRWRRDTPLPGAWRSACRRSMRSRARRPARSDGSPCRHARPVFRSLLRWRRRCSPWAPSGARRNCRNRRRTRCAGAFRARSSAAQWRRVRLAVPAPRSSGTTGRPGGTCRSSRSAPTPAATGRRSRCRGWCWHRRRPAAGGRGGPRCGRSSGRRRAARSASGPVVHPAARAAAACIPSRRPRRRHRCGS